MRLPLAYCHTAGSEIRPVRPAIAEAEGERDVPVNLSKEYACVKKKWATPATWTHGRKDEGFKA